MTRVYTTLRIAFLSCFIAYSVVEADVILKVTGDNVNLRAIADGESEVVSQVSRGAILYADKFEGGNWVEILVPVDVAVWVYADLVRDDIVAVSKLSVRSGPGINYRTIGMLLKGEKVISHGILNGWLKITAPTNCRVWISSKYVELANATPKQVVVKPVEQPIIKPVVVSVPKLKPVMQTIVMPPPPKVVVNPVIKPAIELETKPASKSMVPPAPVVSKAIEQVKPTVVVAPVGLVKPVEKTMKPLVIEPEVDITIIEPEIAKVEVKELVDEAVVDEVIAIVEQVDVVESEFVEPIVVTTVKEDKYAFINKNDLPEGIDYRSLVLSMSQGKVVVLSGRLKRAGRILRCKPSSYRLVGSAASSYIISEDYNLQKYLGATVKVTGKSYRIQGVRDMVVSVDDITIIHE